MTISSSSSSSVLTTVLLVSAIMAAAGTVGVSAAAPPQCAFPDWATSSYNFHNTANCDAISDSCYGVFCNCTDGRLAQDGKCVYAPGVETLSCDGMTRCLAAFTKCIDVEVAGEDTTCTPLVDMRILAVGTTTYADSQLETDCHQFTCLMQNMTKTASAACTIDTTSICVDPASHRGRVVIDGEWVSILASFKSDVVNLMQTSLTSITGHFTAIGNCTTGSLITDFVIPGVPTTAELESDLQKAATVNSGWLADVQAFYTAKGGVGTLSIVGFSTVSVSGQVEAPMATQSATADEEATCDGDCIVIVVVVLLFVVAIVGIAVSIIVMKKGDKKGTGTATEPTTGGDHDV